MSDDPRDPHDYVPPEDARWQRPQRQQGDRFPMLPDEAPQTAPLRDPPRPRPAPPASHGGRGRTMNVIALFFVAASCGLIGYFALIWQNPYTPLNPLAPPTPLPLVITATMTPSFTPTDSPTLTPSVTRTPTAIPTEAPTLTFTPIFLEGFSTPEGTPIPPEAQGDFAFALQNGRLIYITNPDARGACNWSSIAGSVMDYEGDPVNGYGVHVVGEGIDETATTGSAPGFGPGGFEINLGNAARDAQYVAQLLDAEGNPASPVYTVDTLAQCDLNIAALRFVEVEPGS